jgi:hypothetical protein
MLSPFCVAAPARLFLKTYNAALLSALVCSLMIPRGIAVVAVVTWRLLTGAAVPTPTLLVVLVVVPLVVHCARASPGSSSAAAASRQSADARATLPPRLL